VPLAPVCLLLPQPSQAVPGPLPGDHRGRPRHRAQFFRARHQRIPVEYDEVRWLTGGGAAPPPRARREGDVQRDPLFRVPRRTPVAAPGRPRRRSQPRVQWGDRGVRTETEHRAGVEQAVVGEGAVE
jgi:hypothetical protein